MLKLSSLVLTILICSGCTSTPTTTKNSYINQDKNIVKPKWLDDEFVGVSKITASGNKSKQKQIALQRAITFLLMSKGSSQGSLNLSVEKELNLANEKEHLTKRFHQNSRMNVTFKDITYDISIVDTWEDPYTKEIYVKIKER